MQELTSYRNRQKNLLEIINNQVAVIRSNDLVTRNHDTEFPFRQSSSFNYLCGFGEHDSLLVISPAKTTLFLRETDPFLELWMGKMMGTQRATDILDVDEAYDIKELAEKLPELLDDHQDVYVDFGDEKAMTFVKEAMTNLARRKRKKTQSPHGLKNLYDYVGALRLVKDNNERARMQRSADIAGLAHRAAMATANKERNEADIENLMEFIFKREGASGAAYGSIIAGGENALCLHYIENNSNFKDGDLILIDAGAEFQGYASDITRTFPVSGKFTEAQKEIYQLVLDAQIAAIALSINGKTLDDIHNETCRVLCEGLVNLGILEGDVKELIANGELKKYYPHGTSHWLGMDVHDQCPYKDENNETIKLAPGMSFTIEPGLYFPTNDPNIPEKYRGIGIRIEDDIMMDKDGAVNMTASVPKTISEVERACSEDPSQFLFL
ncbi:MAG: M24 family metallopeptidase [Oligoflexia bacterium]|nr:M24 family metallopeptidase [Oligoflexia bacterium]